ncbi:hypothetical protein [Chryseobacterium sp.]|uniref:hypothetical protein n=1 Tax=Chryseobacterium sp. TaxID=1871047 RepID=UPI00289C86DF|nr:hypothetical protein [Chryseobacterium sp.]
MKYLLLLTLLFFKCHSQAINENKINSDFTSATQAEIKNMNLNNYELVEFGKIRNEEALIGDLVSRMWQNFGKPNSVMFEGFDYYIKDNKTGIIFIYYFGASGPAYASDKKDIEKIKPRIQIFEEILDKSKNADCEIEVTNDFGVYLCGAKNGIPYDKQKQ